MVLRSASSSRLEKLRMHETGAACRLLDLATRIWRRRGGPRPLQVEIDLTVAFRHRFHGHHQETVHSIRSCLGCAYTADSKLHEGFGLDLIESEMKACPLLAIYIDLLDYTIAERDGAPNESQSHSCMLLLARKNDRWYAYYFNPHGGGAWKDSLYELYQTRTRMSHVEAPSSIDGFVMSKLIDCLSEQTSLDIQYDASHRCNYKGTNLQKHDSYGVCYAFPVFLQLELAAVPTEKACSLLACGRGGALVGRIKRSLGRRFGVMSSESISSALLFLVRQERGPPV